MPGSGTVPLALRSAAWAEQPSVFGSQLAFHVVAAGAVVPVRVTVAGQRADSGGPRHQLLLTPLFWLPQQLLPPGRPAGATWRRPAGFTTAAGGDGRADGRALAVASTSRQGYAPGYKTHNQDRCFAYDSFVAPGQQLFGVFDGHGAEGHRVAAVLASQLPWAISRLLLRCAVPGSTAQQPPPAAGGATAVPSAAEAHAAVAALMRSRPKLQGVLLDAFAAVEASLSQAKGVDTTYSGSTAVIALLHNTNLLQAAWAGDSRAILVQRRGAAADAAAAAVDASLPQSPGTAADGSTASPRGTSTGRSSGRRSSPAGEPPPLEAHSISSSSGSSPSVVSWRARDLTLDHKPERPDERLRIHNSGGRVAQLAGPGGRPVGPFRVWSRSADGPGGLAMSRAFGDAPLKRIGVTARPEFASVQISPGRDAYLVVGSDGVFDFLGSDRVAEIVGSAAERAGVVYAAEALVAAAEQRWKEEHSEYIDDITAVVVRLDLSGSNKKKN